MTPFLKPTNDYAFRRLFGQEHNKHLLVSFLNSVLELPEGKKIVDLTYEDPSQLPRLNELKYSILDVRVKDQRNVSYIVEMQIAKQDYFEKRALYYISKNYSNQLKEGEDYIKLNPVVFLGILDFVLLENKHFVSHHNILEKNTGEHFLKDFQLTFIELPKFNKNLSELVTEEDRWIYFLKNAQKEKEIPANIPEKEIIDAYKEMQSYQWTSVELLNYEKAGIAETDFMLQLAYAEKQGLERGLEQGLERGMEQGDRKRIKKTSPALFEKGFSMEAVAELFEITVEELKEILDSND